MEQSSRRSVCVGSPSVTRTARSVRVIHVAPTSFGADGLFGGGERYPLELARALARAGRLRADHLWQVSARSNVSRADCGVRTLRTVGLAWRTPGAAVRGRVCSGPCAGADIVSHASYAQPAEPHGGGVRPRLGTAYLAVTDHGLQGDNWGGLLPRLFDVFLTVSAYSARELGAPPARTRVIYGGADPVRYAPDARPAAARRAVRRSADAAQGRRSAAPGACPTAPELRVVGSTGHDPLPPERDYPHLLRHLAR